MRVNELITRLQDLPQEANVFVVDVEYRPWTLEPTMVAVETDLRAREGAILDSERPFLLVVDVGSPIPCGK